MFAKSDAQDRGVGSGRREWLLPVALFFVSVGALARLVQEFRLAPHQQVLGRWLGPGPMFVLLTGMAALGVVWYLRGTVAFPFRKVLALLVFCLPLACFLGTLQGVPGDDGLPWGGFAGRSIARTLPAMVGVGGTGLLMLFSLMLAWKLAFTASQSLFTDPLSPALRTAFAGIPAGASAATLRAPAAGPDLSGDGAEEGLAKDEGEDALPAGEVATLEEEEEEGSLFAPRPSAEPEDIATDDDGDAMIPAAEDDATGLPAHLVVPHVLDGLLSETGAAGTSPIEVPEPIFALQADEDDAPGEPDDGVESRLLALEKIESRRDAEAVPEPPSAGILATPGSPLSAVEPDGDVAPSLFAYVPPETEASPTTEAGMPAEEADPDLPAGRRLMFRTGERVALTDEEIEAELESDDEDEVEAGEPEGGEEDDGEAFGAGVAEETEDSVDNTTEGSGMLPSPVPQPAPAVAVDSGSATGADAGEASDGEDHDDGIPAVVEDPADDEPLPGMSWHGLRTPRAEDEPTVVMSRVRTEEAPAPDFHLRAEMEAGGRTAAAAAEDWAAWDDEERPRPRTRAPKPRRTGRPEEAEAEAVAGAAADPVDQQILFAQGSDVDDGIYRRAVDFVMAEDRCSAAMLQRMLPATFSEATAIIERMHDEGVVGPQLPSGRRELLRR